MTPRYETIQYRLPDGHIFEYVIDYSVGITNDLIDGLISAYFSHTGHEPETVFIRTDLFADYLKSLLGTLRYDATSSPVNGVKGVSMWSSTGHVSITTVSDAHIPLLIGSQSDYDDNNINWLFEEIVLKNCERE